MSKSAPLPTPTSDIPELPPRADTTHKGQVGRIAIIAGSRGMSGAAILSGLGALRGGAGLVRVYCPESIQPIVASAEPCLMTAALPETAAGAIDGARIEGSIDPQWPTVMAIGPGLGESSGAQTLVQIVLGFEQPLVIDADGLNSIARFERQTGGAGVLRYRSPRPTIVTPHPGEMARLREAAGMTALEGDDDDTRLRIAHEYACFSGAVVVLKGHRTIVCTKDQAYINTTGNPGMATGGMGDVLTGLIAALLGQGLDAFGAARLGVYCHGLAADMCAKRIGPVGYLARDVVDALPVALVQASAGRVGFR